MFIRLLNGLREFYFSIDSCHSRFSIFFQLWASYIFFQLLQVQNSKARYTNQLFPLGKALSFMGSECISQFSREWQGRVDRLKMTNRENFWNKNSFFVTMHFIIFLLKKIMFHSPIIQSLFLTTLLHPKNFRWKEKKMCY